MKFHFPKQCRRSHQRKIHQLLFRRRSHKRVSLEGLDSAAEVRPRVLLSWTPTNTSNHSDFTLIHQSPLSHSLNHAASFISKPPSRRGHKPPSRTLTKTLPGHLTLGQASPTQPPAEATDLQLRHHPPCGIHAIPRHEPPASPPSWCSQTTAVIPSAGDDEATALTHFSAPPPHELCGFCLGLGTVGLVESYRKKSQVPPRLRYRHRRLPILVAYETGPMVPSGGRLAAVAGHRQPHHRVRGLSVSRDAGS